MNPASASEALEVLRRPGTRRSPPILFVHGAWVGAWIWEENFLGYFQGRGHEVHALSLRGHGASPLRGSIRRVRLRDYVEDVATVAASLRRPPILVGHSMGGLVVQHFIEHHEVAAAVLLCSVPPGGVGRSTLRVARVYPGAVLRMTLTMRTDPLIDDVERAYRLIAYPRMTLEEFRPQHARMREDSFRAFLDMTALDLPRPTICPGRPVLVLGGEKDFLFDAHDVRATAAAYGVEAQILEGMDHNATGGPGWEGVAERLTHWIEERFDADE